MKDWISLHALMAQGRAPDALVGHDGSRWVRWQEFATRVGAYAAAYSRRAQQRWLLVSDQPLEFAAQCLGLLHAGKHVVIPPNTQPGMLELLRGEYDSVVEAIPEGRQIERRALPPLQPLDPLGARIDLYTSGSTGTPKPIRKTLRQFEAELTALEARWGALLGASVVFGTAPHHHLYGLTFRVLWPLSAGRPTDNVTCSHPGMLIQRLDVFKGGILVSSPAQLSRWPEMGSLEALPARPTLILSSGGPLHAKAAAAFRDHLGAAPTEIYGSTETGVIAWRCQNEDDLWTPMPEVGVSVDSEGALVIDSPFLEGNISWRMSDAVDLTPDGRFRLKGRLDRTVKIEEKRLYLPDMEEQLASHPAVASAAVVPLSGTRQFLGAAVVLSAAGREHLRRAGRRALSETLRQHLQHYFDRVLLPRRWRFPDQLPFNERGKLTAAALMSLFDDEA
jgi:acyl-coenzyme A synthetase/AMP-(fatty) acid ligase